jgi:hypothetical protein
MSIKVKIRLWVMGYLHTHDSPLFRHILWEIYERL